MKLSEAMLLGARSTRGTRSDFYRKPDLSERWHCKPRACALGSVWHAFQPGAQFDAAELLERFPALADVPSDAMLASVSYELGVRRIERCPGFRVFDLISELHTRGVARHEIAAWLAAYGY